MKKIPYLRTEYFNPNTFIINEVIEEIRYSKEDVAAFSFFISFPQCCNRLSAGKDVFALFHTHHF